MISVFRPETGAARENPMPHSPHERRDPRIRSYVLPTRVVWHTEGAARPEGVETLLEPSGVCILVHEGEAPAIVLDFGRGLFGGIRMWVSPGGYSSHEGPVRLRVRFGETVSEVMCTSGEEISTLGADVTLAHEGTVELGQTGFRFVRLQLIDEGTSGHLCAVEAISVHSEIETRGAFRCSDDLLNRIWEVGAYTLHTCMQECMWNGHEHLWNAVKIDRETSATNLLAALPALQAAFGMHALIPGSLGYARDEVSASVLHEEPTAEHLSWIIALAAWYQYAGDETHLSGQREVLLAVLRETCKCIGPDGRETISERWDEPGLACLTADTPEAIHAGFQGLTALALRAGAELCHALGETEVQVECQAAANLLWLHSPAPTSNKYANALLALAGLADMKETNERVLRAEPFDGISPVSGYTVLQARAMAGDIEGGLELIRNYWGGMLDMGATTFWEHFDPAWKDTYGNIDEIAPAGKQDFQTRTGEDESFVLDLCYSASAGPTAWLTEHVLGLKPVAPGCDAVMVNPNLAGLDWAEGALPTPHGVVRVRAEKTADGRTKIDLDAPQSVRIVRG